MLLIWFKWNQNAFIILCLTSFTHHCLSNHPCSTCSCGSILFIAERCANVWIDYQLSTTDGCFGWSQFRTLANKAGINIFHRHFDRPMFGSLLFIYLGNTWNCYHRVCVRPPLLHNCHRVSQNVGTVSCFHVRYSIGSSWTHLLVI